MNMQAAMTSAKDAFSEQPVGIKRLIIDAGVERIHVRSYGLQPGHQDDRSYPSSMVNQLVTEQRFPGSVGPEDHRTPIYLTGKLAEMLRGLLGRGKVFQPSAALWSAAQNLSQQVEQGAQRPLAVIDLSASGYMVVGVDEQGRLKDDLLIVNPHCGAGTGANIDRILQKLDLRRNEVDALLTSYLGESNATARERLTVRADRCGVFSSSATISDKNQGIPVDFALAITLKSEVMKVCKRLTAGFDKVYLTGGVFAWQFARDCAEDYLHEIGVREIAYDADQALLIQGVQALVESIGDENLLQPERRLRKESTLVELPDFQTLRKRYITQNLYQRMPDEHIREWTSTALEALPVTIGLDVGSTMAKIIIADAQSEEILFLDSYSNCGDTIETIKHILRNLQSRGVKQLNISGIGITGSARYQVQEALREIYPQLKERISVLVENYAHSRGSIDQARAYIHHLKSHGIENINEDFFILVDIGGEDTKLSTVSLQKGELFDNAMNVKCSAGTGSLMDSLSALFGIADVAQASQLAFTADKAFLINATCAVFLIENARKLQAQGHSKDRILASCSWAIVENMARTLWSQVELPKYPVVLLHGQTMLSEPLPLAVTHRMQEFLGSPGYALVPPNPGHRACLGLIKSLAEKDMQDTELCNLDYFISRQFNKRIVQCHGAACGDRSAVCNRTMLSFTDTGGKRAKFTLGGCTAVNEFIALKKLGIHVGGNRDTYKEIWDYIDQKLPRSTDSLRLVIPRSFAVSEWAYFFARIFQRLGIPVHVDNVQEHDLTSAQPYFNTDTCAPQIGAVGQYLRLASEPHGMILVPQIEFLPTDGISKGSTCTVNQGGGMVAKNIAEAEHPDARFQLFKIDLSRLEPAAIANQILSQLTPLFAHYGMQPNMDDVQSAVENALIENRKLKEDLQELAADIIETALQDSRQVGIVVGREYILNPGIYDSHVGRLLRDKQILALPAYVLNVRLDPDYAHIYWRNPHVIVSLLRAIAEKKLHTVVAHPRLRELFKRIETDPQEKLLPVVQVSTFRCGPDSITAPLIAEIMKKRPFLLIQSDAVIKELAHLENRMNTYAKQLELGLHGKLSTVNGEPFEIRILDDFRNTQTLDKEKDVIYFPTLSDNRTVTAAIRAAGFTCIDNYDDQTYNLVELVKLGRRITGDSVCTPLAAVYGDILRAVEDFSRRKEVADPLVAGKQRILIFSNKGTGPCRQGQYPEVHKLFAYQTFGPPKTTLQEPAMEKLPDEAALQLLVGKEESGYDIGIDEWAVVRAFQGVILQGVLHAMLFKGGSSCLDYDQYQAFLVAYRRLKNDLYKILEHKPGPGRQHRWLLRSVGQRRGLGPLIKYFAYRLHDRELHRLLRRFSNRWIRSQHGYPAGALKIYIDGEAYMRTSQAEEIFQRLLALLGFRRFILEYSPLWYYLSYRLEEEEMVKQEKLRAAENDLAHSAAADRPQYHQLILEHRQSLARINSLRFLLREILARPLYRAAGVAMPDSMPSVLQTATQMMPTLRPFGELAPYIGEVLRKLRKGYDLCLNVAPEGCMVSSMGATLSKNIQDATGSNGRIQNLFSADGDVDEELLSQAVLKAIGPYNYYQGAIQRDTGAV